MKKITMMVLLAACLALITFGCSKTADTAVDASASPVAQTDATATPSGDKVEVSADGSKFEPAVSVDKIPDEAWACVMDKTVHYATMTKGEGKCKICKMKLVQHAAHQE